jgi:hypothetical protein
MTTSPEAPELIQYSCELCKTRFVLPPSSRRLGIAGTLRAFFVGIGRSLKTHQSMGDGFGAARRDLLSKMDDDAYQAFVLSFRFCHECRQFVCNDCWSKSRGTCLTCAAKVTAGPARIRPIVTAAAAVPDIPRPVITRAPQRRGRPRRDFALVGVTLAIVLISIEGGVLLLNATSGPPDVSAGQTQNHSLTPGNSALRQWIVTPPPNTPGGVTPGSTNGRYVTGSDNPTGSLAPGQTPRPGTTRRPTRTLAPGETPPPATPPPPGQTPSPTPTPAPGQVIVTATSTTISYGDAKPTITVLNYNPPISPATPASCDTTYVQGDNVGGYPVTCSGASDPSYTFQYVDGTVTVNKAPVVVTAFGASITYGDFMPSIALSYSPSISPLTQATCDSTYVQYDNAGSYPATCSGAFDPNYSFSYVAGSIVVGKRSLHVTADPQSIAAGTTAPAPGLPFYTYSYSGAFVQGSDTWVSWPTCGSSYVDTAVANDTFPITCSADAGSNYSVGTTGSTLTVIP